MQVRGLYKLGLGLISITTVSDGGSHASIPTTILLIYKSTSSSYRRVHRFYAACPTPNDDHPNVCIRERHFRFVTIALVTLALQLRYYVEGMLNAMNFCGAHVSSK